MCLLRTWYKLLLIPGRRTRLAPPALCDGIRSKMYQVCNRYELLLIPGALQAAPGPLQATPGLDFGSLMLDAPGTLQARSRPLQAWSSDL